jgi:hypothetical protein
MVVSVTSAYPKATAVYRLKECRGSQNRAVDAIPNSHNKLEGSLGCFGNVASILLGLPWQRFFAFGQSSFDGMGLRHNLCFAAKSPLGRKGNGGGKAWIESWSSGFCVDGFPLFCSIGFVRS